MNVELLRKIAAVIQEKPSKFDMVYLHSDREGEPSDRDCGTSHCIAGWAGVLLDKDIGNGNFRRVARCSEKAESRLLFDENWPEPFRSRYQKAKQRRTRAKVAAARIEHFIATNGAE